MVRDSRCAEKTSENDAEDSIAWCGRIAGGVIGRERFAGAGITGEFEPGIADMDGRRAWAQWEHVGYGRMEFGVEVWIDFDEPARAGIFEGAVGVRV